MSAGVERAGVVGLEQLSVVRSGEAGVVKVNDWPTKIKRVGTGSVVAHPSKPAKGGAPTLW